MIPPTPPSNPSTIEEYLQNICVAMQKACEETIPLKAFLRHKRPGWNCSVNAAHRCSKAAWKRWKRSSRPSDPINPVRESYLKAKHEFRNALRTWKWDHSIPAWTWIITQISYFNSYIPNLVPSQTWLTIFLSINKSSQEVRSLKDELPTLKSLDNHLTMHYDESFLNIVDEELTNMTSQSHEQP